MGRTKSTPRRSEVSINLEHGASTTQPSALFSYYSSSGSFQSACHRDDSRKEDDLHCNITSFLAQVQIHNIDILSVTWQSHLESVAFGGTAEISQSLLKAHMSLAFKRIRPINDNSISNAYQALISEVCILGQRPIRDHPHILRLQGVCFEAPSGETDVWPVLVFEKAKYGSLKEFMEIERGSTLTFHQRLGMIYEIISAIALVHSSNIIHGDIKPENILIFEEENKLIPRICDFGYSTISASKDERKTIIVPKSEPWNAPEHTFDRRSFLDAQKMDVYSTALLCLWFLFYSDVSGFETLSVGESHGAIADLQSWSWPGSIEAWKQSGSLGHLISALVKKHVDIEEDLGDELIKCLSSMTTLDPEMRTIDLGPLVDILQERLRVVARNIDVESMLNRDVNDVGLVLSDLVKPDTHQNFEIVKSLLPLAYANYRVRHCVYQTLEKQYSSRCHLCSQNAAYQLAVCHSIGFSARPDKDVSETWLERSEHSLELLQGDIYTTAHTYESTIHYNESLSMFWNTGHLHLMNPNTQVKLKEELYEERRCCIDDIENASLGLSPHHTFVLTMRIALVPIEVGLGNLDEACDLCEGIVKELMLDERYGAANVGTWTAVSALAATQYLRGNYARAAELQEEVLDRLLVLRGENDLHTLCAMSDLSLSYYGQDKLDDAKTLLLRIVGGIRSNLGMEHPSTLVIENDLASIFYRQGDLLEAERLFREVLVTKKKILGIGNRSTLATMGNLAVVARYRGNYAEAETLNRQALQVREDILPAGHLDILTNQGNLAAILQAQGKLEEAEPMALKCLENSTAALGPDHPETLTSMHNMASILRDRGKFNEALDLWLVCRQGKENHLSLGPTHTFTLDTISNLGVLYTGMGRLAEARDCHQYVLDTMSKKPEQKDTVAYFSTMRHLSTVYQKMGDYEKAEELATHAYKRQGELFGDTLSTLATMQTYAAVSSSLGRHEEALQLYRSVLEGRATKFDVKHELILDTVDAIGEELRILGQYEEAENYCRRAFNNRKKMYERTHPDVLQSASNLSMTLVASASQGVRSDTVEVLAEAETLAEIALKGHEELFGLHEASTIHMRWRLGIVKKTQGMIRVAEQTLRRAYEELVEVMPESHPDCQQLLQDLVSYKEESKKSFNI